MKKDYQKKTALGATVPELVLPDVVSVAMADIAETAACHVARASP
jgi:hypothetical protein